MGSRTELHEKFMQLKEDGIIKNAYFQPPENLKIEYPCIIYSLDGDYHRYANNMMYRNVNRYAVTFITKSPENTLNDWFAQYFNMYSFDRRFVNDNLHHNVYNLYY